MILGKEVFKKPLKNDPCLITLLSPRGVVSKSHHCHLLCSALAGHMKIYRIKLEPSKNLVMISSVLSAKFIYSWIRIEGLLCARHIQQTKYKIVFPQGYHDLYLSEVKGKRTEWQRVVSRTTLASINGMARGQSWLVLLQSRILGPLRKGAPAGQLMAQRPQSMHPQHLDVHEGEREKQLPGLLL